MQRKVNIPHKKPLNTAGTVLLAFTIGFIFIPMLCLCKNEEVGERNEIASLLQDLTARVEKLEKDKKAENMKGQEDVTCPPAAKCTVGFSVGLNTLKAPPREARIAIFKDVFNNVGNGYDNNTGTFTAPVKGLYFFSLTFHNVGDAVINIYLYKNDRRVLNVDMPEAYPGSNTKAVTIQVEKGDKMYVKAFLRQNVTGVKAIFTGFLISCM
ncbi:complement C1q tumor necrosis factor-related protein 6-like [Dunckerocampus dactyliophorus]|uniref:complement C1q tumor necrosis factor-related protein 6-like n=1 Tax=Dunckerocampus dactyliophorus TaxID=161453 RepID=UPI0024062C2B|nr:complement C1q tumor necrosis factor-related protein 6-like [Dunckerocampus dactyliophorus]